MKFKIIIPIILVLLVVGAVTFLLRQEGGVDISLVGSGKNAKLPCPDISFSLHNRTFSEKLFSFVAPVFATKLRSPLQSRLCLLEKPILNNPVTLLYKFKSLIPAPNTVAKIELPESFVLVNGNPEWRGSLAEKEEQSFEVIINLRRWDITN